MEKNTINKGWVSVHRQLLDNPISSKPTYLSVWIHLLLMANHKETSFIWNGKKQTVKAGQVLTGLKKLSEKTGIAQATIYRILKYLENEKQIEQQKTTKYTLITIVNWDKYQKNEKQNEKQMKNKRKTNEKQMKTYNNVNNENNENNISNDIGKKPSSYGNEEINACISYLKQKIDAELDGSVTENRRYCYNLLRKLKKQYPDTEAVNNVKLLIDIGLQDRFHRKNITSFKYLFYNAQRIIQSYKSDYGIGKDNSDIEVIA